MLFTALWLETLSESKADKKAHTRSKVHFVRSQLYNGGSCPLYPPENFSRYFASDGQPEGCVKTLSGEENTGGAAGEARDLQGNNLTVVRRTDFQSFTSLHTLHLQHNQIHTIEKGAFDDLTDLVRLRVDRNQLTSIPDNLFSRMSKLERIDLSYNQLQHIGRKTLKSSDLLKNVQMDHNQISCVADEAIRHLEKMEILTLSDNNLTSLPHNVFEGMPLLRVLRISDNHFVCDCHLAWLARWLRKHPGLALFTECAQPLHLKNAEIAELQENDFKCIPGYDLQRNNECILENMCPRECRCIEGVVDCRDKGLTEIPDNIPESATEIRLEENHITQIPSRIFSDMKKLRRIDLSNNQISFVAPDAFSGLHQLSSLVLYGNKITELPPGVFNGLTSLQLLSLYDNKIQSLANGTFAPLRNIQTLHLARNPFICDCNLQWLADYLKINPIETSGARCETPRRMRRKKITRVKPQKYKCKGSEIHRTINAGTCMIDRDCPRDCVCLGTSVDCSSRGLQEIPQDIPMYTTELKLGTNQITRVPADGLFKRLPNLQVLDLSENEIHEIEDGAFEGADKLTDLQLSNNQLTQLAAKVFQGLPSVKSLMLRGNKITCINNATFAETSRLRLLSLYDNQIRCIMKGSFDRLHYLSTLNLMANPFSCNCHLGWLADWLKRRNVITGTPTCTAPHSLKNTPIQDLKPKDFVCEENNELGCHMGTPSCCPDSNMVTIEKSCDPRAYCPPKCTCTGTVVRCSRQELQEVPKYIPLDTTEFDLSHNNLVTLPEMIFSNLTTLATLTLSYNDLQCIADTSFLGLQELRILALGGNPLNCDCNLKWLSDWIKSKFVESGIAACHGPRRLKSQLLLSAPSEHFECLCKFCENKVPYCKAGYNYCVNGATCVAMDADYRCECPLGFQGKNCSENIDDCKSHVCLNGAACQDGVGSYTCMCAAGFSGQFCEIAPVLALPNYDMATTSGACKYHQCQNNAMCYQPKGSADYMCKCAPGFHGKKCERMSSVSLKDEDAYLQFPQIDFRQSMNITIVFSTDSDNGILLYSGDEQHVAVELFRGRVRVSFDVGNYPVSTMFSYERVDDGQEHTLEMLIKEKNFTMTIDNKGTPRTIINEGPNRYLSVNDRLYLGGLPSNVNTRAFKKWHIRDGTSFRGCMSKVYLNQKQLDLMSASMRHKVTPGCSNNPCHNHMCQRAPTCREIVFRDIYVDPKTKCQSKVRIKYRRCEGSCGNDCCVPKRIKTRKVRLFCENGSTYVYDLPVIRRCACKKC
ncbi:hypothetical protein BaRGS_00019181 [Batillaria attramentaria]|uniref:Uncharacterized protein n=1 Tax=Batillaria attramentaria TaxID=370345 RepID=A0ABD0KQS6_9CAEN